MKKIQSIFFLTGILLAALAVPVGSLAQNCEVYFPTDEGTELTYKSYNKRDKLQSSMVQELTSIREKADTVIYKVHQEMYDDKDGLVYEGDLAFKCSGNKFIIDMRSFINPEQMEGYRDMEMEITMDEISIPAELKPGMKLDEGYINMAIDAGMMSMNFKTRIFEREVMAKETVTVPAGNFEAYKISSSTETKTAMMTVTTKSISWYSPEIGMVRSESYNKKDKLQGYTVLTGIEK